LDFCKTSWSSSSPSLPCFLLIYIIWDDDDDNNNNTRTYILAVSGPFGERAWWRKQKYQKLSGESSCGEK
jgi:hypothetical protein